MKFLLLIVQCTTLAFGVGAIRDHYAIFGGACLGFFVVATNWRATLD